MRRALAFPLSTLLASCSLLGLDAIAAPVCTDDQQCDVLNARYPERVDACTRYQCSAGRCALTALDADDDEAASIACGGMDCDDTDPLRGPAAAERCDGVDDDCDLIIDEHVEVAPLDALRGVPSLHALHVAPGEGGVGAVLSFTDGSGAASIASLPTMSLAPVEYASSTLSYVSGVLGASAPAAGCAAPARDPVMPPPPGGGPMVGSSCAVHADCDDGLVCNGYERCEPTHAAADPATGCRAGGAVDACDAEAICDEASDTCVAIDTLDCTFDALAVAQPSGGRHLGVASNRVGCGAGQLRIGALESEALMLSGLPEGPSVAFGVPAECAGSAGASAAALATLVDPPGSCGDAPDPQALLAWYAAPEAEDCERAEAVEVRAIGVWLADARDGGPAWPHPTDDGEPSLLGRTRASAPPAIVAWPGQGFFVAHAAEDGVTVRFVEALGCHPTPREGERVPTAAIALGAPALLAADPSADQLALALSPDEDGVALGLAWRTGCAADARVMFLATRYNRELDAFGAGVAQLASEPDASAGSPAIAFSERPFLEAGAPHGSPDASTAGWLVAWIDDAAQDRMRARRYSALDAASVDSSPFVLSAPSSSGRHTAASPFLFRAEDGSLLAGYHDRADEVIRVAAACGAP